MHYHRRDIHFCANEVLDQNGKALGRQYLEFMTKLVPKFILMPLVIHEEKIFKDFRTMGI